MCSDSLVNGMLSEASFRGGARGVWEVQGSALDASIEGGSCFGCGEACTKPTVADLQNGGQDRALCLGGWQGREV